MAIPPQIFIICIAGALIGGFVLREIRSSRKPTETRASKEQADLFANEVELRMFLGEFDPGKVKKNVR